MTDKDLSFEDALEKLEQIIEKLENEEATLDESFKLFEQGMKLGKFCSEKLDQYESKVEIILKENEQDVREPFVQEENK